MSKMFKSFGSLLLWSVVWLICVQAGNRIVPRAAPIVVEQQKGEIVAKPTQFMRVVKEKDIPVALDTANVRYEKGDVKIDLLGAIHIADKSYYDALNKQFEQYDALLYELVAMKGEKPEHRRGFDPYTLIGMILELDAQLRCINYTPANFVHADMSPLGLLKAINDRGHDGTTLILSVISDLMRQQNLNARKPQINMEKLAHDDFAIYAKRVMAAQMDGNLDNLGPTLGAILVEDRNQAAMKVLGEQITAGKKKIGIFYGAAHMPDFEKRLTDMGFKRTEIAWQRAWDIRPRPNALQKFLSPAPQANQLPQLPQFPKIQELGTNPVRQQPNIVPVPPSSLPRRGN